MKGKAFYDKIEYRVRAAQLPAEKSPLACKAHRLWNVSRETLDKSVQPWKPVAAKLLKQRVSAPPGLIRLRGSIGEPRSSDCHNMRIFSHIKRERYPRPLTQVFSSHVVRHGFA